MSRPRGSLRRRLIVLSGMLPVVVAAVLMLYRPSLMGRLDDSTYDLLLRSAHATPPAAGVVIVDIDERSLTTVGQWPWRRDVVGRLISRLRDAGGATARAEEEATQAHEAVRQASATLLNARVDSEGARQAVKVWVTTALTPMRSAGRLN